MASIGTLTLNGATDPKEPSDEIALEISGAAVAERFVRNVSLGQREWDALGAACGFDGSWPKAGDEPGEYTLDRFLKGYGRAIDRAMAIGTAYEFKRAHGALIALVAVAADVRKGGEPFAHKMILFDGSVPRLWTAGAGSSSEFEDVLRDRRLWTAVVLRERFAAPPPPSPEESLARLGRALEALDGA